MILVSSVVGANTTLSNLSSTLINTSLRFSPGSTYHIGVGVGQTSGPDYRPLKAYIRDAIIVGNGLGATNSNPPYGTNNTTVTGAIQCGNQVNVVTLEGSSAFWNGVGLGSFGFLKDGVGNNCTAFINLDSASDFDVYLSRLRRTSARTDLLKFGSDGSFSLLTAGTDSYKISQGTASTTDATVTTVQTVATATDTSLLLRTRIVGRRTGGSAGSADDSAVFILTAVIKNIAGTVTVNALQTDYSATDQAAWAATLNVSSTNVLIQVNGDTNNNVSWSCTTETQKI